MGAPRRRTQRRHPQIQPTLFQWGLRHQRIQKLYSRKSRKPFTRIASATQTSSGAPNQSIVRQPNPNASTVNTKQPMQAFTGHTSFGAPPRSLFQQHNLGASTSNTTQPLHAVANPTKDQLGGRRSITVFGYEDWNLLRTKEFLRKQNVNIVIREESELNIMLKQKMKNLESHTSYKGKGKGKQNEASAPPVQKLKNLESRTSYKGKGKGKANEAHVPPVQKLKNLESRTSYNKGKGKGKENEAPAPPVYWPDKVTEFQRIHSTRHRGWGIHNKIFVMTELRWPSLVEVDTSTFQKLMYRAYGGY